jgi:hypothetical protein
MQGTANEGCGCPATEPKSGGPLNVDMVYVEWVDTTFFGADDMSLAEAMALVPDIVRSVGHRVYEDDEVVTIAMDVSVEGYAGVQKIPKSTIRYLWYIDDTNKTPTTTGTS